MRSLRVPALLALAWPLALAAQPAAPPVAPPVPAVPAAPAAPAAPPLTATAQAIYADARPRLLQIRTLVQAAGGQSTIGSGFLVSADGFALTNYHVVSQYVLDPATYRLEYAAPDGSKGGLRVHAIDVANDLAVLQLDRAGLPHFEFDPRAVDGTLPKGERLFAMGNPLDLGFTIVEGTYNGLVDRSYNERIHFSGALNPGMSGGPTVTESDRVAGVNVAKQIGGDLVSFLVPARHAVALLERARRGGPMTPDHARADIAAQLTAWQGALYAAVNAAGSQATSFGPYRAPQWSAPFFSCWSHTNADATPRPRALVDETRCSTQTSLFVANDLATGQVDYWHAYVRSVDLNAFQFATFLSQQYESGTATLAGRKRLAAQKCSEDFVATTADGSRPVLRVIWCARAYRDFEGLYDVTVTAVTQDRDREALITRLGMRGATYESAQALARRFLDGVVRAP
jgi:S1-C subfamily serine protease